MNNPINRPARGARPSGQFVRGKSGGNTQTKKYQPRPKKTNYHQTASKTPVFRHLKNTPTKNKGAKTQIAPLVNLSKNIRIIPLGGVEEVGKNMMVLEYLNDILIFDAGVQFTTEESPGIDYILPNTTYLEERQDKIRGLIITHGHLDHIGGIPYIIDKIGNPPLYGSNLTTLMIKKKMEEFPTQGKQMNYKIVEAGEKIKLGNLTLKFFPVTHSIPGALGISIETPLGNVVITGDLKLEHSNETPTAKEEKTWGELGQDNNLLLIADSTNVEKPGYSMPEQVVYDNIEQIIKYTKGRLIVGTFASQFERMIKIFEIAEKYGKKIITEGRSINTNLEIAKLSGLFTPKKDSVIPSSEIGNYPADRIIILATGSQGEEFAALTRLATKKHKYIFLNERDTVVLSSSIVPGNELAVRRLEDNLYRYDLKVIHYRVSDVHSTGHGNAQELAWINQKVGARFFMPAYGHHSMLKVHAEIAKSLGIPPANIVVPDNGSIIEIQDAGQKIVILKEKAPSGLMMVDGLSVGNMQEVVIRDRQCLAQDGIFVIIVTIDLKTKRLKKSPDIISRGFVYLRESQELLKKARYIAKTIVEKATQNGKPVDFDQIKVEVAGGVSRLLLQTTNKRPIVIPVILGF